MVVTDNGRDSTQQILPSSRTMIFLQEELTSGVLGYLVIEYIIWIGTLIFVLLLIVALM